MTSSDAGETALDAPVVERRRSAVAAQAGEPVLPPLMQMPEPQSPTRSIKIPPRPKLAPLTPLQAKQFGALLVVGSVGNLALRTGLISVASVLAVAATVIFLIRTGAIKGKGAKLLGLAAILTACWLPLRTSPWLAPLNVIVSAQLIVAAVAVGKLSLWQVHPMHTGALIRRSLNAWRGPELMVRSSASALRSATGPSGVIENAGKAVLRGLLLALIPLVPIVALLASADAVFASLVRTPGDAFTDRLGSLMAHGVLTLLVATVAAGLFTVGHGRELQGSDSYRRPFGSTEATVVLVGLVAVFSAFAVTQLVTAMGGANHILETANLTRADYAREGFFQLLAVSVITLAVLFSTRVWADNTQRRANFRLTVLATIASLLTLVIVAVSLIRLALYVDAFGLTMLRLYSMLFGGLIGVTFLLYIGHLLAPVARLWFVPAVSLVAWMLLMGLNAANPEARVTAWNISHQTTTFEFDAIYATRLSSDTIPTLVDNLDRLDARDQDIVNYNICEGRYDASSGWGPLGWNWSQAQAESAAAVLCVTSKADG